MNNFLRRSPVLLMLAFVGTLSLLGSMLTSACARNQRADTLRAGLITVNSAREAFGVWDLHHQQQLVEHADTRDAAIKNVAEYRDKRQRLVETFETAYRGLADAALEQSDDKMTIALKLVDALVKTFKTFTEGG